MEENKGFKSHEASEPHITASLKWCNFKESFHSGNIIVKMQAISRQDILDNRHFIKTVIQAVVLCSVQDLGLRGHREGRLTGDSSELGFSCGDRNRGNFLEILSSYAVHDPVVRRKLMSGPSNAQYTHHSIQDQLISLLSKYFLRQCSPRLLPGCTAESAREHRRRQSVDPEGAEVSVQDEMVLPS